MRVRLQFYQPQDYATRLVTRVAYKERSMDEQRVRIVHHQDEHYVFEIENVPSDFDQIALRLYVIKSQQSLDKLSATKLSIWISVVSQISRSLSNKQKIMHNFFSLTNTLNTVKKIKNET